jgi:hypothetical protein
MESVRQAFNIDFNLSKRTAIPSSSCTSAVRSPAAPLQIRQRWVIMCKQACRSLRFTQRHLVGRLAGVV